MTDIDFEELDRAIASLTSQQGAVDVAKPGDSTGSNNIDLIDDPAPAPEPTTVAEAKATPPVAATVSPRIAPDRAVKSQPVSAPAKPVARRPRPSGLSMDIVVPAGSRSRTNSRMRPVSTPKDRGAALEEPIEKPVEAEKSLQPESPFIADAKIEKRPLGSAPIAEPEQINDTPVDETTVPDEMLNAPLPEELHPDVLSLDSLDVAVDEPEVTEDLPEITPLSESAKLDNISSVDDELEAVSIYDTDTYHKPLSTPQKKHSALKTTVWVVLTILLIAGIAAAAYFLVLPMIFG